MTHAEKVSRAEQLAAQLRTDTDNLLALVAELKQEANKIAAALLEAKTHDANAALRLPHITDAGDFG